MLKKMLVISALLVTLNAGVAQARTNVSVNFYPHAPVYAVSHPAYYSPRPVFVPRYEYHRVRYVAPRHGHRWHHRHDDCRRSRYRY